MASVQFTSHLSRHVQVSGGDVDADSLSQAFEFIFEQSPKLRSYLLDDQNAIRQHVAVFVDGVLLRDRQNWDVELTPTSEVYVMQALSGG